MHAANIGLAANDIDDGLNWRLPESPNPISTKFSVTSNSNSSDRNKINLLNNNKAKLKKAKSVLTMFGNFSSSNHNCKNIDIDQMESLYENSAGRSKTKTQQAHAASALAQKKQEKQEIMALPTTSQEKHKKINEQGYDIEGNLNSIEGKRKTSNSNQFRNNGQDSDFGANSLAASERGDDDNEMNNEKDRKLSQLSRPEAKLSKTSKTSKTQTLEDRI